MPEGEVRIRVSARDDATSQVNRVKQAVMGLVAAWLGFQGVRKVMDTMRDVITTFTAYTSEVDKAHKVTGIAMKTLQEMAYAAEQEHASFEQLQKGLMNLTIRLSYAGDGLETYLRYFRALGIEYQNADGTLRDTYDVFLDIADVVKKGSLSTEELAAVVQLFGARAGKELIPLLKKGSQWFKEMGIEAHKLNKVLEDEIILRGKELADTFTRISTAAEGVKLTVGEGLLPILETALPWFEEYIELSTKLFTVYALLGKGLDWLRRAGQSETEWIKEQIEINKRFVDGQMKVKIAIDDTADSTDKLIQEMKPLSEWLGTVSDGTKISGAAFLALKERLKEVHEVVGDLNYAVERQAQFWTKARNEALEWADGMKEVTLVTDETKEAQLRMFEDLRTALFQYTAAFASSVVDSIYEGRMEFGRFVRDFLLGVHKMIVQMMVFAALKSVFGLKEGGVVPGLPGLQSGGVIPGGAPYSDRVLVAATPGEGVLNRMAMANLGREDFERLNRGQTISNQVDVNIVIQGSADANTVRSMELMLRKKLPMMIKDAERRRQIRR